MNLFGSSGARGALKDGIDPPLAATIAGAATRHWEADRVAIGRDGRLTGPSFAAAATAGATAAGADVDRVGVAPTPAIQLYAEQEGIPAIVITASHNPAPHNGIKLFDAVGGELAVADYAAIERRLDTHAIATASWEQFGSERHVYGTNQRYRTALARRLDVDRIRAAQPTIVVDTANGPGGLTSPRLFRSLGCTVHTLNAELDGRFPGRRPEPIPDVLGPLADLVEAVDADLGIAHDGDADRAVFVDETGAVIDGGAAFAALAAAVTEPGDAIVSGMTASLRLADVARTQNADLELTRVGAAHIGSRVRELHAAGRPVAIAGEENGGIIFPQQRPTRDGAFTAGKFLALITDRTASQVIEPYSGYSFVRRDLPYEDGDHRDVMLDRALRWAHAQPGEIRTLDGVRIDRDDGWVLVRPSGTEQLIRVYAEAREADLAKEFVSTVVGAISTG